eukprot:m.667600 g.667600  ORF g.667600 m.667600 type:complete len:82 (-) comp58508_c0_seq15:7732-7977(-)
MVLLGAGCCAGVVSVLLALRWGNADHEFLELQGLLRALPQLFFAAHCVRSDSGLFSVLYYVRPLIRMSVRLDPLERRLCGC